MKSWTITACALAILALLFVTVDTTSARIVEKRSCSSCGNVQGVEKDVPASVTLPTVKLGTLVKTATITRERKVTVTKNEAIDAPTVVPAQPAPRQKEVTEQVPKYGLFKAKWRVKERSREVVK